MPNPDIYKLLIDKLWSLLESRTLAGQWGTLVKQANRIKLGDKFDPYKNIFSTTDRPQAVLILAATKDQAANLFPTFGSVRGTCSSRISEITVEATLGLTHQDFRRDPVNALITETQAAWENAQGALSATLRTVIAQAGIQSWGPITIDTDWTGKRPPMVPITDFEQTPSPTTIIKSPMVIRASMSTPIFT